MTLASSSVSSVVSLRAGPRHHPAALVLALGFEVEHALLLQLLEGRGPEIAGAGSRSRAAENRTRCRGAAWFQDAAVAPRSKSVRQARAVSLPPCFDLMQRCVAQLLARFVLRRFPARTTAKFAHRDPSSSNRSAGPLRSSSSSSVRTSAERFSFEVQKPDHDVRDLHAGVVDVVLHLDLLPGRAQQAHEGVAQNRRCAGGRCARPCWD